MSNDDQGTPKKRGFTVTPSDKPKAPRVPVSYEYKGDDCSACAGTGIGPGQAGPVDGRCHWCRGTGVRRRR